MTNRLKMLSIDEVAELTNVHRDTVLMWREIGIIKAIRTGKNYMFTQDEISRFQHDYIGLDVSNRVKALASLEQVNNSIN